MATLRDISKYSGYSIATISRVLNGSENVSEDTRKAILKAVKDLDYHPSNMVKKDVKHVVGVIVPNLVGYHYPQIIDGIEKYLVEHGYEMLISTAQHLIKKEIEILDQMYSRHLDGIIVCTTTEDDKYIEKFIKSAIPVIAVDREDTEIKIDTVGIDNFHSALKIAEFLHSYGHKKVLFVEGDRDVYSAQERKNAFFYYMNRNPDFKVIFEESDFSGEGSYESVSRHINEKGIDFTAIFFCNDQMALGGMKALWENGYKVPDDISVVGFDDADYSKFVIPPLTTMKQPRFEIGVSAAQLIVDRIEGKGSKVRRKVLLPTSLIVRDSVKKIV